MTSPPASRASLSQRAHPSAAGLWRNIPVLPGSAPVAGWPLASHLELRPVPESVRAARRHARQALAGWGLADVAVTAELVVSELTTNAITAARELPGDAPVQLWLCSDEASVIVAVHDASPRPPVRSQPTAADEAGRGLVLVDAISSRWGCFPASDARTGDHQGKIVWAVIPGD